MYVVMRVAVWAKCTVMVNKQHCTQTFGGVRHPHFFFWGDLMIVFHIFFL